jgi:hypothetical protein
LFLIGCATGKLEKRKLEKGAVYQSLSPRFKALVDREQIANGMSEDAVYVAWGKPTEVLEIENAQGPASKWLYKGTYFKEQSSLVLRPPPTVGYDDAYARFQIPGAYPKVEKKYIPHDYVKFEIDFLNGVVVKWHPRAAPR